MSTEAQIAANRRNSEKCTGPTSQAGKARSSQNALKTGLDAKSEVIRCESRPEYDTLIAEYFARFQPAVPEERNLVDTLIRCEWLTRRYYTADTSIWNRGFADIDSMSMGTVYLRSQEALARVDRRINSAHRNFQSALKQLNQLQTIRRAQPIPEIQPEAIPESINPVVEPEVQPAPDAAPAAVNPELVLIFTPVSESAIQHDTAAETRSEPEDQPLLAA